MDKVFCTETRKHSFPVRAQGIARITREKDGSRQRHYRCSGCAGVQSMPHQREPQKKVRLFRLVQDSRGNFDHVQIRTHRGQKVASA